MARYIDADAAVEETRLGYCKNCNSHNGVMCRACAFDDAMSYIEDYPEADVVPKSEVEMLQYEADRYKRYFYRHDYDKMIAEAKAEAAREIFEEIYEIMEDHAIGDINDYWLYHRIEELKKKYTEGVTDES